MSGYGTPNFIEVILEFTYRILNRKWFLTYTNVFCKRCTSSCQFCKYQFWTNCVFESQMFNSVVSAVINRVIRMVRSVTHIF